MKSFRFIPILLVFFAVAILAPFVAAEEIKYIPQVVAGKEGKYPDRHQWTTDITLMNTSTVTQKVLVQVFSATTSGTLVFDDRVLTIPGDTVWSLVYEGIGEPELFSGWAKIVADETVKTEALVRRWLWVDGLNLGAGRNLEAAVTFAASVSKTNYVVRAVSRESADTGLAVVNPGDLDTEVRFQIFNSFGPNPERAIYDSIRIVPARNKLQGMFEELFQAVGPDGFGYRLTGGYIRIVASRPIVVGAIRIDTSNGRVIFSGLAP